MKTEYIFTPEQQAELDDIARQIRALYSRQAKIYMSAHVRYLAETPAEVRRIEQMSYLLHGAIIRDRTIANIIFGKGGDTNGETTDN